MKITIRAKNLRISTAERDRLLRRVDFALSQFRQRVRQAAILVQDENAQRGGVDKTCRILARVAPLGDIVAEATAETLDAAAGMAAERAARSIARGMDRLSRRRKSRISMAGERTAGMQDAPLVAVE
jgi:ribosome-associated translation inhibitor RaiA